MRNLILSLWYRYKHYRYTQKCLKYFGAKPETIYLSKEDFEALQKRLAEPPDPKAIERFREILNKPAPWDEQ